MALLLAMVISGCSNNATSILGSTVAADTYSGAITCAGAITDDNGTTRFEGEISVQQMMGESGLPVENDLEAAEGNKIEREIGGYVATLTVGEVTAAEESASFIASGYTEAEVCADEACSATKYVSIEMIVNETYTPSEEGGFTLDSLYTIYIWDDGETTGNGSYACTGTLIP